MIRLKISNMPIDEIDCQLAVLTAFENVRPLKGSAGLVDWRMSGKLSHMIYRSKFLGEFNDALLMPTAGKLDAEELLWIGVGARGDLNDHEMMRILEMIAHRLMLKKSLSFCLSLSDVMGEMFKWRNAVRILVSMFSGRKEELNITLVEKPAYIEDAKKRHMEFAYDVQVIYELI